RLDALERRYRSRASVTVLLQVWNRPLYTIGGAHLLSDALRLCGARNVFADLREASPVVETEAVIARDPQLIVAIALPGSAAEWLQEWRRFARLRAVRDGALIGFEDTRLTRLGPSALPAAEALCEAIDAARPRRPPPPPGNGPGRNQ